MFVVLLNCMFTRSSGIQNAPNNHQISHIHVKQQNIFIVHVVRLLYSISPVKCRLLTVTKFFSHDVSAMQRQFCLNFPVEESTTFGTEHGIPQSREWSPCEKESQSYVYLKKCNTERNNFNMA